MRERTRVRRRDCIRLLAGAAASSWPLGARSQQAAKLPTIGFLGAGTPSSQGQWFSALVQRLRELGWIEGQTVVIEVRWAEGRAERYVEIATEFVRLNVDVIATYATLPTIAAKQATAVIPIVSAVMGDPVGVGLVTSLGRPGGNVTGLSNQSSDLAGKRLELLREVVPNLRRLAILGNVSNPLSVQEAGAVQVAARALGFDVVTLEIRRPEDIAPTFETLKGGAQALYVLGDPLIVANRTRINILAAASRLPAIYNQRIYVEAGGLMSYGPDNADLFRRAADFVDKILRGAKPADLPVEQPSKFELVININTAKVLGLTVPALLLARVDEVIE